MSKVADVCIALTIPTLILLYTSIAPYTKIEESFTIQATHDILKYGIPFKDTAETLLSNYDHLRYPELHPVPRTFVAPLILAAIAKPFTSLGYGIDHQILVRRILGVYNAFCLLIFRNSIRRVYGKTTANWYSLLQACQFHIIFYSSRTLPNFVPFGLSTVAIGLLIRHGSAPSTTKRQIEPALIILTVLGIVFRSELAIFLACHTIYGFIRGRLRIQTIIISGAIGVLGGLLLTVPLDSFLWQRYPLWPELNSFLFNVYEGRSIDWGTSPWYYYFVTALPKILFNPATFGVCIPFALFNSSLRQSTIDLLIPNLAYVALYSFQPHKEWRFIVYAMPDLTAAAAQGASWIWIRRAKSAVYSLLTLILVFTSLASFAASLLSLSISTLNYPGGEALYRLQTLADGTQSDINVHMDVLTAQTGATLFLQLPGTNHRANTSIWKFDKTDDKTGDGTLLLQPEFWSRFDYALAERTEKCIGAWEEIEVVDGLVGVGLVRPGEEDPSPVNTASYVPFKGSARARAWTEPPLSVLTKSVWKRWKLLGTFMRKHVTGGWWVDVKMQPKIRILKRISAEEIADRILEQQ